MLKINNRFWFKLHGWLSLPVWALFCFICITGTISVISHELTWLTNPNARAANPADLPAKPAAELVQIVKQAYPTADVTNVVSFEPYLVNGVLFTDHDKPVAIAYVNQYSGEIQEVNQGITFINFMRSLHGWLLFPWHGSYSIGYYLVSLTAFVTLGAVITGMIVYKGFWRAFTQPKLRMSQGKKTFLTDLHKLSGVWSIWFLLVMGLTGLWYLIQAILWHVDYDIEPHPPLAQISQLPADIAQPPQPPLDLNGAMAIAKQRYPEFSPSYLMMPEHPRDTFKLYGGGDHAFYDEMSYFLAINPWNKEVVGDLNPDKMDILQTLAHIADPLHYGTLGGLWTKAIWFVFGLIISGMSVTGFLIWGSRTVKAARQTPAPVGQTVQEG
ncbi:PepSY-associated TM helix domain-containing protein [Bowmanella dokdonensis]|uniref:PepSY domain-containing protein n=1 Tax=Bowmanella dokdonensis TaxID=751969 RepID=A0A939IML3_9ALTE|nr:PepSY-associated TM helix domain-containing protein [Bowmanella dokdonensis]MBN7823920.1 PepSY domain-containing protein [Bowmanella dokdonensis]